jgi:hypothetical protein
MLEVQCRVGAALTTTERVGTARRPGSGKRDGEVHDVGTSGGTPSSGPPARTWWMWAGQQCMPSLATVGGGNSGQV